MAGSARTAPVAAVAANLLLRCKSCGTGVPIDPTRAGQTVTCSKCGNEGMVPAVPAPTAIAKPQPDPRSRRVGVGAYWQAFALIAILTVLVSGHETEALWVLALGLPIIQLLAAPLALILIAVLPGSIVPSKAAAAGAIGKIALAVFAGSAVGFALMIPLGVGLVVLS